MPQLPTPRGVPTCPCANQPPSPLLLYGKVARLVVLVIQLPSCATIQTDLVYFGSQGVQPDQGLIIKYQRISEEMPFAEQDVMYHGNNKRKCKNLSGSFIAHRRDL